MESINPPLNPQANPQMAYVPVATPVQRSAAHPGHLLGYIGIVCAVVSLLILPPVFGLVGIILGVVSKNKGENTLGLTTIILSAVFMVIGMILSLLVNVVLKQGHGFILGPLIYSL
jgi:membrane-associated protease RseP (regulator of RpoE activity)